jgi:hypothetical protein
MKYQVYADYGYISEALLHTSTELSEAVVWAEQYVSEYGFEGYNIIEVAYFTSTGEYITVAVHRAEDHEQWNQEDFLYDEY